MASIKVNGTTLHYEDCGSGEQTIVFSHGLLWSTRLFDPQVSYFSDRFRCLSYDHRGQGRSDIPDTRSISIETLAEDAIAFIESRVQGPCHFVGLSMGGFVGMRVAARRPDLVQSLVLMATQAGPEPAQNVPKYRLLNAIARGGGLRFLSSQVMPIMFGPTFLSDDDRRAERRLWRQRLTSNRRRVYRAVNGVLERGDFTNELSQIVAPCLVLRGEEDAAISLEAAQHMSNHIHGAMFVPIPQAGHSCSIEQRQLDEDVASFEANASPAATSAAVATRARLDAATDHCNGWGAITAGVGAGAAALGLVVAITGYPTGAALAVPEELE